MNDSHPTPEPFAGLPVEDLTLPPADSMWLRYSWNGVGRTGLLRGNLAIVLRDFPLDTAWSDIAALDNGRVAFYSVNNFMVTIGEVTTEGRYVDVANHPRAESAHRMLAVYPDMLLFVLVRSGTHGYVSLATTGRVGADGSYTRLSEPLLWDVWTHIVGVGNGVILAYNRDTRLATTGRFSGDGGYSDLQNHPGFDDWTGIHAMTDGTLLFYNTTTGAAATGRIAADGGFTNLHSGSIGPARGLVTTRDNQLLIDRGADTLVTRLDTGGWFTDTRIVNGLIRPLPTLFVR